MHKFFINKDQISDERIYITGEDHLHISKSLRMKRGDKLEVSDGNRMEYIGKILDIDGKAVKIVIEKEYENNTELPVQISLFQGIAKGSKLDLMIQKTVELGVAKIIPLLTERTVVNVEKKAYKKIERWKRISLESAKQSKRGIIPEIRPVIELKNVKSELSDCELLLIAYEDEQNTNLKQILRDYSNVKKVGVFIGPEGGFAEEEIEILRSFGGLTFSLGNRILRTETAGLAVISMLTYEYEMRGEDN